MSQPNTDYDSAWKSFIELYFQEFLTFFFPDIESDIDWSKPIRFLDKELLQVVRDAEISKRYADKLVEVHRKSGEKAIVICHIEVQNEGEPYFDARMYCYNYRLRDRYNCPVVSLAILTDDSKTWRPNRFQDELWGCSTEFRFPIVKLLDYGKDWASLEASRNPFAVVTMAQLKTRETHNKPEERKTWRYRLTDRRELPLLAQRRNSAAISAVEQVGDDSQVDAAQRSPQTRSAPARESLTCFLLCSKL
jgi:hypothetical protein